MKQEKRRMYMKPSIHVLELGKPRLLLIASETSASYNPYGSPTEQTWQ